VQSVALSVLRHRVVMNFQAEAEGITVDQLIQLKS
jgi:MoxR-like ATPase